MENTLYKTVSRYSDQIKDDRTLQGIFNHGMGEMDELQSEILYDRDGLKPGPDGIVGEAIDVIACMLDIIRRHDPLITESQLVEIMDRKCLKWVGKYG
jgi:hypothetical protein